MDPARTKKVARKVEEAAARPPQPPARFDRAADGSSSRGRGGSRGGRGGMCRGGRGASSSSAAAYGGRSEHRRADGSGPDRSLTYQQRPARSMPYARPGGPSISTRGGEGAGDEASSTGPPPTKAQASLSLSSLPLPAPLPSLASHPHLNRLDLSKVAGGLSGVGVGWVGDAFGAQITWLNISHCPGLGEAGPRAWRGFEKLTGLVVLTLQSCALTELPLEFASLRSLKAFVATHNELSTVPEEVVSGWPLLNSLILSHNPLQTLPSTLPSLMALAKLSLSNTPLPASALESIDLSPLPYLRMLSASHTPQLDRLPAHFRTWGTGLLPAAEGSRFDRPFNSSKSAEGRRGDGLEVVELGGSGVTWKGLQAGVGEGMPGLRSLGLKGCPVTEREDYKDSILALLPALQILDNTRLIERKRKGPALVQPLTSFQASKVPGKEEIDAAAVAARAAERGIAVQGRKREWGVKRPAGEGDEGAQADEEEGDEEEREARRMKRTRQAIEEARQAEAGAGTDGADADDSASKRRKRKPHAALEAAAEGPSTSKKRPSKKAAAAEEATPVEPAEPEVKKRKRKPHSAPAAAPTKDSKWREKQASKPVVVAPVEEPAAAAVAEGAEKPKRKRKPRGASPPPDPAGAAPPKAAEKTSVLKVIEVKPARRNKKAGKASSGGLDLEQAFKQPTASVEQADAGGSAFGTGGWDD